jgi:hypothetical protein
LHKYLPKLEILFSIIIRHASTWYSFKQKYRNPKICNLFDFHLSNYNIKFVCKLKIYKKCEYNETSWEIWIWYVYKPDTLRVVSNKLQKFNFFKISFPFFCSAIFISYFINLFGYPNWWELNKWTWWTKKYFNIILFCSGQILH